MIKTVTYDTETHRIVPLEPNEKMEITGAIFAKFESAAHNCYVAMVQDAPEYHGLSEMAKLQLKGLSKPIKQNNGSAYD